MAMSDINEEYTNEEYTTDAKPWAAYVLGYHPNTLRLQVEGLWYDSSIIGLGQLDEEWGPILEQAEEMRVALRILAIQDCVNPAIQYEMHRAIDRLADLGEELLESGGPLGPGGAEM